MAANTAIPAPSPYVDEDSSTIVYLDDASRLIEAQRVADRVARDRRFAAALELTDAFVESFDESEAARAVSASPFADFSETYDHQEPLLTLAYNLHLTKQVVERLCEEEEDPIRLSAAVSRSVELGLHCLYDPRSASTPPRRFLAAAKKAGYFFTPPDVASALARGAIAERPSVEIALDPASGAGALLAAAMIEAKSAGTRLHKVLGIELDSFTADISREFLTRIRHLLDIDCDIQIINDDAIGILATQASRLHGRKFDCILMNPPYGRVKFHRDNLTNAETKISANDEQLDLIDAKEKETTRKRAERFRAISASLGGGGGAQDYQRLFMALALGVLSPDGTCAMISADSWLGDANSQALRKKFIDECLLSEITLYPENVGLFATVNQSTAVTVLDKTEKQSFQVRLMAGSQRHEVDSYQLKYNEIRQLDPMRLRVPRVSGVLHKIYAKLAEGPRLKDIEALNNARGEVDQTLSRDLIQEEPSSLRLVRGDHLERFTLRSPEVSSRPSFVSPEGFAERFRNLPKGRAHERPRIVGRQCSYQKKARRLSFALAPAGVAVGNSCNYVSSEVGGSEGTRLLRAALVVLNSVVSEFFFRLFNSNNHVANYELDELPMCFENDVLVNALAQQGSFLEQAYRYWAEGGKVPSRLEDFADALVAFSLGLSEEETQTLVMAIDPSRAERIAGMVLYLNQQGIPPALVVGDAWYQHISPNLSDLDREIINYVPQGGNWQDIPITVPSKRLDQIREMTASRGVCRTTYYGRLRPDQPAYTIATYFNRPGNGTNIHPWENRTLTSREAARLQSFPDWYLFTGSEGAIRKQIGNAVPPLLAFAIGTHFRKFGFDGPWVDLFSGAGGLSLGLEEAGCSVAAAVDVDSASNDTYRLNRLCEERPSARIDRTLLLECDLSVPSEVEQVVETIGEKLGARRPSAIVGGPPCQGFSHAGWRSPDDERNHLASSFMSVVADLEPELVVLENVEGLLTYDKGEVLEGLVSTLRELGYFTGDEPWLLRAETFGVPQMRRRVFLVASKTKIDLQPPEPFFQVCRGRREIAGQASLTEDLPYPFTVAEALSGLSPLGKVVHESMGNRPVRGGYLRWLRDECGGAKHPLHHILSGEGAPDTIS